MSQATTWGVPGSGPATPTVYAGRDNDSFDAVLSQHSGTSRPSYAVSGTVWVDVVSATEENTYRFDGTDDILLFTINPTANTVTYSTAGVAAAGAAMAANSLSDLASIPTARTNLGLDGYFAKNLLINARGNVNQRGYLSGTATVGANEYTVDRWRVVTSGQNLSWTESEGTKTFTAPAGGVEQVIEGASIITGTYVISWTGTATCTVDAVAKASGDTFTLTGGTNATIKFIGGTFSLQQVENGSEVTPLEQEDHGITLAKCQRYYQRLDTVMGAVATAATIRAATPFPVEMRAAPTLGLLNSTPLVHAAGSNFTGTASTITASSLTTMAMRCTIDGFTGMTTGWGCYIVPSDLISLDAEL